MPSPSRIPRLRLAALALAALAGCAPEAPEPEPYEQPAPWDALTPPEREEFMERLFLPAMEEHFVAWDPDAYAVFVCSTCHGPDGEAVAWEMPSEVVPSIGLSDIPVEDIDDPERRAIAVWMDEVILPEMGALFEQELTLEGASCLDCHPFDPTLPGG